MNKDTSRYHTNSMSHCAGRCISAVSAILSGAILIACCGGCTSLFCDSAQKYSRETAESLARTVRRPLALITVPAASIVVDGELEEWEGLNRGYFEQLLDQVDLIHAGLGENQSDAAAIQVRRDDAALYVAIRVVDESVTNPHDEFDYHQADCAELFIDVALITTAGNTNVIEDISLSCRFVSSSDDQPDDSAGRKPVFKPVTQRVVVHESLDVAVHYSFLEPIEPTAGHYYFDCAFPGVPVPAATLHCYHRDDSVTPIPQTVFIP